MECSGTVAAAGQGNANPVRGGGHMGLMVLVHWKGRKSLEPSHPCKHLFSPVSLVLSKFSMFELTFLYLILLNGILPPQNVHNTNRNKPDKDNNQSVSQFQQRL